MHIEHLYYLQEIARTKSFSVASNNLYISQQSLSETVAKLEKQFNLKIFHRSRSGTHLTEKGEEFLNDVNKLLKQYEVLQQKYDNEQLVEPQSIKICVNCTISNLYINRLLKRYHEKYPNIAVTVVEEANTFNVIQKIIDRKADVGFTTLFTSFFKTSPLLKPGANQEFSLEKLYMDYLCVAVNKNHPFAAKQSVTFADLAQEPLVMDNRSIIEEYVLGASGNSQLKASDFNILLSTGDGEVYMNAIRQSLAVGFTTKLTQQQSFPDETEIVAIPLKGVTPMVTGIALPMNTPTSLATQQFINIFKQIIAPAE